MSSYVKNGDNIRITNLYGGNAALSYLGASDKGSQNVNSLLHTVGTYQSYSDYVNETQWTIALIQSSGNDDSIYSGDQVSLVNAKDQGSLALFNSYSPNNTGYPVGTSNASGDPAVTVGWSIIITTANKGNDARLMYDDQILLVTTFNNLSGVLDTNGAGYNKPFQYLVTGARLANRDGGSGAWKVLKVQG
ncbi:hypothetical protein [Burkholderia ambifaria]|uniref:Uncharacterized protein n=1 Tax=Burkholderia ambifaria MEX-5 TaxID=396597 RepID=B1T8M5_9BURK|nr:hypothetical protein [Burkholderia ambifaria]EDT40087.1 conserved hypothetical protein [Burkholderia ambifaria MEX-5]